MEESIRKAEELIEEANTALTRMQNEAWNDDFGMKGKKSGFDGIRGTLSPREKIVDEAFGLSKRNSILDEINRKIGGYALEFLERESAKPGGFDPGDRVPATRTTSDTNLSQRTVTKLNITEDLTSKLQETQVIVDRGIRTARELNETVEVLKSSKQQKGSDEISLDKSEKLSEAGSAGKTVEGKRCKRCKAEITRTKKEDNVLVTRVKGRDCSSPGRRHRLNFQQLPSLKIPGDLTCQRIPSVDIPPGKRECFPHSANVAYETYSHEEIIRGGIDKIIEDMKNSNSLVRSGNGSGARSVKCSSCGNIVRVTGRVVPTEQIDQLLEMCDYNVFDPRIDEFVERLRGRLLLEGKMEEEEEEEEEEEKKEEEKQTQTEAETSKPVEIPLEIPKVERKISQISSELTRKYREKATELESDHLEFEGILRELFEKMEESRALFKNCDYLNAVSGKRKSSLSVTPPVLLSFTGSGEEADDGRNAVLRPRRKTKLPSRAIRKNPEKKELEINCKLISSSRPGKNKPKTSNPTARKPVETNEEISKKSVKQSPPSPAVEPIKSTPKISTTVSKQSQIIRSPEPGLQVNLNVIEESVKETNTDYESDFEEESSEEKSRERDNSYRYNTRLSTISEVDTESDRKISDMAITPKAPNAINPTKESSASSDEDDTRKLMKKVNQDLKEIASLHFAEKSETVKDVAEPLKEVLNALKNQFERTEILADRLTETIKDVNKTDVAEEISVSNGHRDLVMVSNLERARKNQKITPFPLNSNFVKIYGNIFQTENKFTQQGGQQDKQDNSSPSASFTTKGSIATGKSYSEGEISEEDLFLSDRSSPSIGEVINENYSDGSLSQEKDRSREREVRKSRF